MRPDRIIVGEIRRQKEAEVMFEAMHTGHAVYATVHADTVAQTITRLVNPPISTPPYLLNAVNLSVVQFRDRRAGVRRTYQLGEFIITESENKIDVKANIMYRWKPSIDKIVPHAEGIRFFEELSRHTGFNKEEIDENLQMRKDILNWMVKHKVKGVDSVGAIMNQYYMNKETLLKYVKEDTSPTIIYSMPNPFREMNKND